MLQELSCKKNSINRIYSRVRIGANTCDGYANITAIYVRDPVWIAGLVVSLGDGTVFDFLVVRQIGPTLVPGLVASDMIFLASSSAKISRETLRGPLVMRRVHAPANPKTLSVILSDLQPRRIS